MRNNDHDDIWLKQSELNKDPYTCYNLNREDSTGGCVALFCRDTFKINFVSTSNEIYESATWSVTNDDKTIHITGVYHPPPKNTITNVMFLDRLTDHLTSLLPAIRNNVILGDFNLHVDDPTDNDAQIFNDKMLTLGLNQHVVGSTHQQGNCLDLICMENGSSLKPAMCQISKFILDHRLLLPLINIRKPSAEPTVIEVLKNEDTINGTVA